jgi:hypothetical protein
MMGVALQAAAVAALRGIEGCGVYDAPPLQAVFPHAVVEYGPETDWSHKSGKGREVRIAVSFRDAGERPARLHALMAQAEAALETPPQAPGWQTVSFQWLRSRSLRTAKAEPGGAEAQWSGVIEYRARMLALPDG